MRKPAWLNKKIDFSSRRSTQEILRQYKLSTVCEESRCPNIGECFKSQVATFLILGDICTRNCAFCAIKRGLLQKPDITEPLRLRQCVERFGLKYVVVTSPTRDDLFDGGAGQFSAVVNQLKKVKDLKVEILVPDFQGNLENIKTAALSGAEVFGHNLETVPRLYSKVRLGADYSRSLKVLEQVKKCSSSLTKSSLMLGLGETFEEVCAVIKDLRSVDCDLLVLGQYLAPSKISYPVSRYLEPEEFQEYEKVALSLGFKAVKCSSYARSSYLAHSLVEQVIGKIPTTDYL